MNTEFNELVAHVAEETAHRVLQDFGALYGFGQEWLDEKQAARLLALSPKTLEKLRSTGGGPEFARVGRLVRYPRASLLEWARSRVGGEAAR